MTRINPTYGRPYPPPARHPFSLDRLLRLLYSGFWVGQSRECYGEIGDRLWRAIGRAA